ncbi:MAG: GNAT family N-acetyltransferase [Clostridia bacterium]|nr:GNAT family N-acetyltransferase [Clostridia bacterium]
MLITAHIDRPLGTHHPRHPNIFYTVNYGYVPGLIAGDGAEQDVYILGVNEPVQTFTGRRIAIVRRRDDVEDKWILAPEGTSFTENEIMDAVRFQEQYFDSYVEMTEDAPPAIRRAEEGLLDAALAIRLDCLRAVRRLPREHAFAPEFCEATRQFLRAADQTTLLAMDGDIPVACATLCYIHYIPTCGHPTGRRAHLMNVYTVEGYRRQGLARELIIRLHAEAAQRGVTEITLDATDEGRRLYDAIGYQVSDEAMYFDMKGNA